MIWDPPLIVSRQAADVAGEQNLVEAARRAGFNGVLVVPDDMFTRRRWPRVWLAKKLYDLGDWILGKNL